MVNTINQGDCEIEIDFIVGTIPYKVIRGIKPNIFEIYKNGKLISQDASNIDYQKYRKQYNEIKLQIIFTGCIIRSSSYGTFMKIEQGTTRSGEEILDIKCLVLDLILGLNQISEKCKDLGINVI